MGSQVLIGSRTSDFTLLELNGALPNGTSWLGWTTDKVANKHNTTLYRISHPNGAPQSYSEHQVDTRAPTCRSWPRGSWIYSRDTVGATQGGSSGSPVLNGAGKVVGQLSGACGFNLSDECDPGSNATVDGAFAAYFSQVSEWLYAAPVSGGNQSPVAGTFTVSLTVTDVASASDSHETSVTVTDGSPANDSISVASLSTSVDCAARGRWTAHVDITISPAIAGASVSGSWGGSAKGSGSCTIEGTSCRVSKKGLKSTDSATFEVTDIQYPGYTFLPGNHAIDIPNTCSSP